jgi:hypothetical protein
VTSIKSAMLMPRLAEEALNRGNGQPVELVAAGRDRFS